MKDSRPIGTDQLEVLNQWLAAYGAEVATDSGIVLAEVFNTRCKRPAAATARRLMLYIAYNELACRLESGVLVFAAMRDGSPPPSFRRLSSTTIGRLVAQDHSQAIHLGLEFAPTTKTCTGPKLRSGRESDGLHTPGETHDDEQ